MIQIEEAYFFTEAVFIHRMKQLGYTNEQIRDHRKRMDRADFEKAINRRLSEIGKEFNLEEMTNFLAFFAIKYGDDMATIIDGFYRYLASESPQSDSIQ